LYGRYCLFERGIEELLHFGLRPSGWLLVPAGDGADADSEPFGECLVAQP
jgi:hypothetical protein